MGKKNQPSNPVTPSTPEPVQAKPNDNQHSPFTRGVILILISSMVISFQNIITRVILSKKVVLGVWETGGFLAPSMGNSILILVLRMLIGLPILAFLVAPRIYNNTWADIRGIFDPSNKTKFYASIGSGVFLFLSSFSIYLALGSIPTGVATTIFFIYPTVTILLLWIIYGEKPAISLVFAMATIYIGGFLTIPEESFQARGDSNIILGASAAAISGITFAGYVIMIRIARMHPAPFSIISFTTILILGSLMLPLFNWHVDSHQWPPLLVGTVALAATTLVGYLLNNFGVPIIGPALTSVISASGPAVTALFALIIINETLTLHQVIGVSLVTLWVIGISTENLKKSRNPAPKPVEPKA